jgi:hypothetical protein
MYIVCIHIHNPKELIVDLKPSPYKPEAMLFATPVRRPRLWQAGRPKDTNVSDQLSVISNQFLPTDHFSLMTFHP